MKRSIVAAPLLSIVSLVSVVTTSWSGAPQVPSPAATPAPASAHPCARGESAQPCHKALPAETSPMNCCDPFRSPCAATCRLVGRHLDAGALPQLAPRRLAWSDLQARPVRRPLGTPDPVPRVLVA